jgi:hypothetical protein
MLNHVWRAARLLATADAPLKDRLKQAAPEFFVSMVQPDTWPRNLLPKATDIDARLQAIGTLDGDQAQQLAEDLLSLAVAVGMTYQRYLR